MVISAGDSAADACTVVCEISYKEAVRFLRKDPTKPLAVRIAAVKDEQAYKRIAAGNEWALVYLEREDFRVEVTACRIGGVEASSNATGIDHPPGLHVLEFSVPSNRRSVDPEASVDIALTVRQTHKVRLPVLIYDLTEDLSGLRVLRHQ
ncbi:MAG: hypothetical protein IPK67_02095 [Planctomycetes bacterium]|nr:hypothetical protein [Planctomycetota bacterium]